jgi:N-acetylated-alpha-linked acidic dipeptidase
VNRSLVLLVAGGAMLCAHPAVAQHSDRLIGFSPPAAAAHGELERVLLEAIHPDSIGRWARTLASRPHVAGTPEQIATRDSVLEWHRAAGLEARYDSMLHYMPHPVRVSVERTHPAPQAFDLSEPPLEEDPVTQGPMVPVFNAFSGSGVAEAEVVYAGYGLPADYSTLDSAGIAVAGKVVIARYGRSFRGIKSREAEARGAVALLLYSDPASDGFVRGEVYPAGPMRPERGVQRGSLLNTTGDPSTPDGPSIPGTRRVSEQDMVGVTRIPVVPIGYGVAAELIRYLGGPTVPESWQGGLELTYRFGPGPVRAAVDVSMERGEAAYHPAFNTIAVLEGAVWPDEWVIIGGHRDAWSPGAIDNVSGTSSVVEVARAFASAAALGHRPRRTVLFATWDAEEWGVVGSIEWVEAREEQLRGSVVAYVNQDAPVSGSSFRAASSPELKNLARDVSRRVDDPLRDGSVFDAWMDRVTENLPEEEWPTVPPVGDLGGGSDHKGFYQHLGIPAIGFGFGGSGGVYHSMYDTPRWMETFGDPGHLYHAATARIAAAVVARLADAEVLPFDHAALARIVGKRATLLAAEVDAAIHAVTATEHASVEVEEGYGAGARTAMASLRRAADRLEERGRQFAAARDAALEAGPLDAHLAQQVNHELRSASLAFTSEAGLPGDRWSRQLLFAADPDNGYATLPLPAAHLALRSGDVVRTEARIRELSERLEACGQRLEAARSLLELEGRN